MTSHKLDSKDYRVIALKIALDDTASKIQPWELATKYYNYIMTGDPTGAKKEPVKAEPVRKKPGPKPGTKYKKKK